LLAPAEFLPFAEAGGLMLEIGDWVFRQAAQQARRWQDELGAGFQVSINQSPAQLRGDAALYVAGCSMRPAGTAAAQHRAGNYRGRAAGRRAARQRAPARLREMGLQVALDNFGTGYSSLSHLKHFGIDLLKLDHSFIQHLASDSGDLAMCEALIVMAHKLGLRVVAEGVETPAQSGLLAMAGCDYAQGYVFAGAVPGRVDGAGAARPEPAELTQAQRRGHALAADAGQRRGDRQQRLVAGLARGRDEVLRHLLHAALGGAGLALCTRALTCASACCTERIDASTLASACTTCCSVARMPSMSAVFQLSGRFAALRPRPSRGSAGRSGSTPLPCTAMVSRIGPLRLGGGECQLAVVIELGAHAAGASASSKRWAICSSLRPGSSTTERTFWPPPIEMASTSRPPLRRLARFMPRTVKAVVVPLLLNFSCASSVPPEALLRLRQLLLNWRTRASSVPSSAGGWPGGAEVGLEVAQLGRALLEEVERLLGARDVALQRLVPVVQAAARRRRRVRRRRDRGGGGGVFAVQAQRGAVHRSGIAGMRARNNDLGVEVDVICIRWAAKKDYRILNSDRLLIFE
jgi:EAL domain-containing protein (putative c-di-GMP-specific phosphodiesterase class I)